MQAVLAIAVIAAVVTVILLRLLKQAKHDLHTAQLKLTTEQDAHLATLLLYQADHAECASALRSTRQQLAAQDLRYADLLSKHEMLWSQYRAAHDQLAMHQQKPVLQSDMPALGFTDTLE